MSQVVLKEWTSAGRLRALNLAGSRYRQRVDLATCPFDSTMLLVQDRRKGDERGPLVQCPSCERYFNFGSRGLEQVPAEPDRPA